MAGPKRNPKTSGASSSASSDQGLKLFLSYPRVRQEISLVRDLHRRLQSEGFRTWLDEVDIRPGTDGELEVDRALRTADIVIICLTRSSITGDVRVRKEIKYVMEIAESLNILIIPVRLEDCDVPEELKHLLCIDLFGDDGYEPLLSTIHEIADERRSQAESSQPDPTTSPGAKTVAAEETVDAHEPTVKSASGTPGSGAAAQSVPLTGGSGGVGSAGVASGGVTIQQPLESVSTPSSKEGLAEEARERRAINDKPTDDIKKDTLGFDVYVLALHEFIASQDTTTPLTISINGAWGSGKSSLMRMLQRQFEPELTGGLWWIQIKWLAGWLRGTFFRDIGQSLIALGYANRDYIRLGLAFDPGEDVSNKNFDGLLKKYIEASLKNDFPSGEHTPPDRLEEERARRLQKTRFWAREAARRRKMKPLRHPTIWFNAWKFNQQEQVWSALALAVLGQLRMKYDFFTRLRFLIELTLKRTDKLGALQHFLRKLIVPLVIAALVALYQLNRQALLPYLSTDFIRWDKWAWLAPVLAAMWQALKAIEDPFKLPVEELVDRPNYKDKIGFIGTFEEDFGRIVEVAIRRSMFWQPRKLVIFIDDLDRCSPVQAAGIVEAINLFLDSVGCVFVLGMDMAAVAISIEVKYKDLTERMRKDAPDSISPGVLFLDKIVQIPFNVPRPSKKYINALVTKITEPETRQMPTVASELIKASSSENGRRQTEHPVPDKTQAFGGQRLLDEPVVSATKVDRASFARDDIREAIIFASHLLKENPRQVKRFINLFRLQVYIAHQRKMLSDKGEFGLTPKRLAVWVAWYMQWPEILKLLSGSAQMEDIYRHIDSICGYLEWVKIKDEEQVKWKADGMQQYLKALQITRGMEENFVSHWSHLPWPLWIKDNDFLCCLKELESYWKQPQLLESMLDMTQVTISQSPASTPDTPVPAINSAASPAPAPASA